MLIWQLGAGNVPLRRSCLLAQAGTKQASKQASKQAPKPTFSLPSLGGKAQQVGKTAKVKAGSAPQKAKQAASSGKGLFGLAKQAAPQKAKQAASSGKGLFGTASVKAKQAAPQKAKQAASNGKSLFGTASVKAKQAASTTGLFGTASTRGKSSTPAKGGGSLGTRSTRPTSGLTELLFTCLLLISLPHMEHIVCSGFHSQVTPLCLPYCSSGGHQKQSVSRLVIITGGIAGAAGEHAYSICRPDDCIALEY